VNRHAHHGEPQDVLDFHADGPWKSVEVHRRTLDFVRAAAGRGLERVRIVTGRGRHSRGAPVVRPQVERTLRRLEAQGVVRSFRPERLDRGGDGAYFVRLEPSA
jgi:DNA-nicking Smr family endonuclease